MNSRSVEHSRSHLPGATSRAVCCRKLKLYSVRRAPLASPRLSFVSGAVLRSRPAGETDFVGPSLRDFMLCPCVTHDVLIYLRVLISDMTSARVERFVLKSPRTALVMAMLPGLRIPRIVIQVCVASSTTTTPLASSSAANRSAI